MDGVNNVNHGDRLNDFEFETAFLKGDDRINTEPTESAARNLLSCRFIGKVCQTVRMANKIQ